jgi:hypothetical protein
MTICVLNRCQVQWALSLFRFQFVIIYHLGCQQRKLDVLSCRSYLVPKEGHAAYEQECDVIFKPKHF